MSINSNMKPMVMEKYTDISSQNSGAKKKAWVKDKDINVAIYHANNTILMSNNVKFNQSTNTGLTTEKVITEANRLNDNGVIYEITYANTSGRLTQLYLKKVSFDGQSK